ncbi:protein ABHD11-like [Trichosurus vulpecula]|uniref:protein ABHD11-like n=1 Tax=Trichosurus vulpecula TaxID=9337 RepID=UPI00186ACFB1|nr:protein ABHD11-like [Trichosurus vulpecula]
MVSLERNRLTGDMRIVFRTQRRRVWSKVSAKPVRLKQLGQCASVERGVDYFTEEFERRFKAALSSGGVGQAMVRDLAGRRCAVQGVEVEGRPSPLSYRLLDGQDNLPPVVFLHGMLSNKNIFQAEAKALAQQTGRKVLTVDPQNHGESPHSPDCSYAAMSADLQALLSKLGLTPCVLIGHSMGSKTAMTFALQKPELVECLVSVDISPFVATENPNIFKIVPAMNSINLLGNLSDSQAFEVVDECLKLSVKDPSIRQYLFNSLVQVDGQYVWKAILATLSQQQNQILDSLQIQGVYRGPTLFLTIRPFHHPKIKLLFPEAQFQIIPDTSHILRIKKPHKFMNSILNFLS